MRNARAARVVALALLWGSSFLWIKIGLRDFSPVQIAVVRMLLGVVVLLAILRVTKRALPNKLGTWGHLAVAAFFGNAIPYLLFGIAEQQINSSTAGVVNATAPLWTVLFTVLTYQSVTVARSNAWSLVLGFAGVILIFSPWRHGAELMSWNGIVCLAAAISYGVSYVYIAHFLAHRSLGALPMATGQLMCATVLTLCAVPLLGWPAIHWRSDSLIAVIILGALGTGIAYILNYRIITDDGATAASIVVYLLPVVAVLAGLVVLREVPGPQIVGGMMLVLIAARLRKPDKPQGARTNTA